MQLTEDDMRRIAWGESMIYDLITTQFVEERRWGVVYLVVFEHQHERWGFHWYSMVGDRGDDEFYGPAFKVKEVITTEYVRDDEG